MMNKEWKKNAGKCCHSNIHRFISWEENLEGPKKVRVLLQFRYWIFNIKSVVPDELTILDLYLYEVDGSACNLNSGGR